MALTWIWVGMVCIALVFGAATGQSAAVGAAAAQGVQQAITFCLTVGEDGPDFAELEFWHNGKYYSISANASDYVPQGLVRLDDGEYYKSCTVTFAER